MASVLLISADLTGNAYVRTKAAIEAAGHTVTGMTDAAFIADPAPDVSGYDALATVRTTYSSASAIAARLLSSGKPMVLGGTESGQPTSASTETVAYFLGITGLHTGSGTGAGARATTTIVDNEHAITDGFSLAEISVTADTQYTNRVASAASWVGTRLSAFPAALTSAHMIAVEAGTSLMTSGTTAARIAWAGWVFAGATTYATDGETLIGRMFAWVLGIIGPAPTDLRILWARLEVPDPAPDAAPTVSIHQDDLTLAEGQTAQLTATVTGNPEPMLAWSSSDTDVATVDPDTGLVTALQPGQVIMAIAPQKLERVAEPATRIRPVPGSLSVQELIRGYYARYRRVAEARVGGGGGSGAADLYVEGIPLRVVDVVLWQKWGRNLPRTPGLKYEIIVGAAEEWIDGPRIRIMGGNRCIVALEPRTFGRVLHHELVHCRQYLDDPWQSCILMEIEAHLAIRSKVPEHVLASALLCEMQVPEAAWRGHSRAAVERKAAAAVEAGQPRRAQRVRQIRLTPHRVRLVGEPPEIPAGMRHAATHWKVGNRHVAPGAPAILFEKQTHDPAELTQIEIELPEYYGTTLFVRYGFAAIADYQTAEP